MGTMRTSSRAVGLASIIAVVLLVATTSFASPARAANVIDDPIIDRGLEIHVEKFVQLPNDSQGAPRINTMAVTGNRLFAAEERDGDIYELVGNPAQPVLFLDVKAAIAANTNRSLDNQNTFHGGLRGLAFAPDFASTGRFYTSLMETRPADPADHTYLSDVADPIGADSVLIEWTYNHGTNQVDTNSYREVFRVGMPVYDHPIKQIAFNPYATPGSGDYGMLYIGHGDGSVLSAIAGGGMNNDALGKILRIRPLSANGQSYTVPSTNPFVGDNSMIDEAYSIGHRNPHTLSFALGSAGDAHLIVGEAGRDNVEEVNLIEPGANYGWPEREGTFVHLSQGGIIDGVAPLPTNDAQNGYVYPAVQVGHEGVVGGSFVKQAIAGGYAIENGSPLNGQYFYADFPVTGRLFHSHLEYLYAAETVIPAGQQSAALSQAPVGEVTIKFDHDGNPATAALSRSSMADVIDDAPTYDGSGRADIRFGLGPDGEMYITNKRNNIIYLVTSSLPGGPGGFTNPSSPRPASCAVSVTGTIATVTWPASPDAIDYRIKRSVAGGQFWWRGRVRDTTSFTDEARVNSTYTVEARGADAVWSSGRVCTNGATQLACSATAGGNTATISWQPVNGAAEYRIKRSVTGATFWWRGKVSGTNFTDTLQANTSHVYRVESRPAGGSWSSAATCNPTLTTGGGNIFACSAAKNGTTATISWSAVPGAAEYRIKRALDGSPTYWWRGKVTGTSFNDTLRTNGISHRFQVESRPAGGSWSAPATCSPDLVTPTLSGCVGSKNGLVATISWSPVPGAIEYRVERSVNGSSFYWRGKVAGESFNDTLRPNSTHQYRVLHRLSPVGPWVSPMTCNPIL